MKQIKVTKNEVETLRDFMFEERALSKALGRVERRKSNFWDEITDKYDSKERTRRKSETKKARYRYSLCSIQSNAWCLSRKRAFYIRGISETFKNIK